MLHLLKKFDERHYTNTKAMTLVLVRCLRCGAESKMVGQNYVKHNRMRRTHCSVCVGDKYHKLTGTRIWRIWMGMRRRSGDPMDKNYGGRGITVCRRWQTFANFYADMHGGYSDDLTIERINVNKPYSKSNCRWASNMEQQNNKRNNRYLTYQGERIHLAELVRRSGLSKMMLTMRLNRGMSADEAVIDALSSGYGKSTDPKNTKRREARTSTI